MLMMNYMLYKTVLCILQLLLYVNSEIYVIHNDKIVETISHDLTSTFGGSLPTTGIKGRLIYLKPNQSNPCRNYEPVPKWFDNGTVWIALMERLGCKFVNMVLDAQEMNFSAVIVHNDKTRGNNLIKMGGVSKNVEIPSVFVGYDDGVTLSSYDAQYYTSPYFIQIKEESYSDISVILLVMCVSVNVIAVFACCFILIAVNKFKQWRRRNRETTVRTSNRSLHLEKQNRDSHAKIRIAYFSKGHRYEVCSVCLEDFKEQEKLWILPCEHEFHVECIKPWLTERHNNCPVCKRMSISLSILEREG